MNSPSHNSGEHSSPCLNVSPDRLNKMSASELADAMEEALDLMTEETYDPNVINAYLDALERRVPVPEHPSAEAAYESFQQKLKEVSSGITKPPTVPSRAPRRRSVWRTRLVAALLAFALLGAMIIAQAIGVDVFGAIARWTSEMFSFGELPENDTANNPSTTTKGLLTGPENKKTPEEYRELKLALEERGLPFLFPEIPEGFEVTESLLYIVPADKSIQFTAAYKRNDDCLIYEVIQNEGQSNMIYEKDSSAVEIYEYNDILHYIFGNEGDTISTWMIDNLEYSLSSNTDSVDLRQLIRSFYKE